MRFSIYREAHFLYNKTSEIYQSQKKQTFPKPGKPAENDFALSRFGNGLRKSDWLKPR